MRAADVPADIRPLTAVFYSINAPLIFSFPPSFSLSVFCNIP